MLSLLWLACSGTTPTPTPTGETGFDAGACEDVDGDATAPPEAPGCAWSGGVCVADARACAGGERLSAHDGECAFDDGPGFCCRPPAALPTGEGCAATGGACAPIAGCGKVHGWFTPAAECAATYGVVSVCCAPSDACEGFGRVACCAADGASAFVATCDRGRLGCSVEGTALGCEQDCPAFGSAR